MSKTWRLLLLVTGTFVFAVLVLVLANSQPESALGSDQSTTKTSWTTASR